MINLKFLVSNLFNLFILFVTQFAAVRKRFENTPVHQQVVPCKDAKAKLLECYKANVGQTLNCANVVTEFTSCIQEHRTKILSEKYQPAEKPAASAAAL